MAESGWQKDESGPVDGRALLEAGPGLLAKARLELVPLRSAEEDGYLARGTTVTIPCSPSPLSGAGSRPFRVMHRGRPHCPRENFGLGPNLDLASLF